MVVEFTTVVLATKVPVGTVTVAPEANPVPVRVTVRTVFLTATDGVIEVTVGAATTVRHPVQVAFVASGLVTVTEYEPVVVPAADFSVTVTVVGVTTTEDAVSVTLVDGPVTATVAPASKPAPETTKEPDAPTARRPGLTEVIPIGGRGTTVLEAGEGAPAPTPLVAVTVKV